MAEGPGESTTAMYVSVIVCVFSHSCPTLCDPMDCTPPNSSVHGIFQARILEWIATYSSRQSIELIINKNYPN